MVNAHSVVLKGEGWFDRGTAFIFATLMLIFAVATTTATAQTYTDLFEFDGVDGANPRAPQILAQGRDGNLYGTTPAGGTNNDGVVFKITPGGTQTVLHNFAGADGYAPYGGLTLGKDGNFYGTTLKGGPVNNYGTIFKITPKGTLTTLYNFTDAADGAFPLAPPTQGLDGNLYGTTATGSAYRITPSGTFTALGSVSGNPYDPLLQATDGNFYGTSEDGGPPCDSAYGTCGTVFKVTPKGVVTTIHIFNGALGENPRGGLIQDVDGNFYGTASYGGSTGYGVVFKMTPQGAITVLYNFPAPPDADIPTAGLVQASDGNFYSVANNGGPSSFGAIYQITPDGAYSTLYNFDYTHGGYPGATPMQHTNGRFYGLTSEGGANDVGVVYSFDFGLPPFVSLVTPAGKAGTTVEILGQGLTGAAAVSFNGIPSTFRVFSDTDMTAVVPQGVTTGPVTVTTPSGSLTSNKPFRVLPAILSFSPTSGPVGTSVTLTGTGLTQTTSVRFAGTAASFTVNSDTQVTVIVPAGAKTSNIQVGTQGGLASSAAVFTVTQ